MRAKRIAMYGLLVALALILSYLESLVPLSFAVPGIKMGLPNIVIVFALYSLGVKDACIISFVRVLLVSILFGNVFSMAYSLAGAALSLVVMALMCRCGKFGKSGVSVAGAVAHNAGQVLMAMLLLETAQISYYLPVLCVSGTVAGVCVGVLSSVVIRRVKPEEIK